MTGRWLHKCFIVTEPKEVVKQAVVGTSGQAVCSEAVSAMLRISGSILLGVGGGQQFAKLIYTKDFLPDGRTGGHQLKLT